MRSVHAVFAKQTTDIRRNRMVFLQFVIFPLIAFAFTQLVAIPNPDIPDAMFITMFAALFAGMSVPVSMASLVAEDRERGSLRLLVMAGVKPANYLIGTGGAIGAVSLIVAVAFALMTGFSPAQSGKFLLVIMLGVACSVLLGAAVGLLAGNQQAGTAIAMSVSVLVGFGPMLAQFSPTAEKMTAFLYTMQVSHLADDPTTSLGRPLLIIAVNMAILAVLAVVAYRVRNRTASTEPNGGKWATHQPAPSAGLTRDASFTTALSASALAHMRWNR